MTLSEIILPSGVQFGTSGARGLVSQMTDAVCYAYTQAFLRAVSPGAKQVIIGHDLRPSSPEIAAACIQAVRDAGMAPVFVGAMPTPAVAYYASTVPAPAIIITGSHIPFDRNGIKFYRTDGEISKADEQAMLTSPVDVPAGLQRLPLPPVQVVARSMYEARYLSFFGRDALKGKRIAVYEHSSVARDSLRGILEGLGADVLSLGRTDTFVPIDTEAVRPEDVQQARQWATEHRFDAILSTDGDADRPLIGDEQGTWLRGDVVGILCAQFLGAEVVVTPVSSNTAVEMCGSFKQVVRTRIGSPYVIAGMESAAGQVVAGYEANGGFLLGSDVVKGSQTLKALPTRDAVLPMLALLCMAQARGVPLSALSDGLPQRFTASDRLQNFAIQASRALLERLTQDATAATALLAPSSGEVVVTDTTDGLRLRFASGDIVHLRPSGNAPELRCYTEASSVERAQILCQACLGRIQHDSMRVGSGAFSGGEAAQF